MSGTYTPHKRILPAQRLTIILCALLLTAVLAQRMSLVLFGYSHIDHPSFDATVSGVLTCDLLNGPLRSSLFSYQYESRSGDSVAESLLLLPFFSLFGKTLFSLKCLTLCSSLAAFCLWFFFLKKHSMYAAVVFGLLYAFPPPHFARLNLNGTVLSHHIINPLIAFQLIILFRLLCEFKKKHDLLCWTLLGFVAGIGSYFFYTYIIFNSFCFLFVVIFKSRIITLSRSASFCLGFAFGFSPWLIRTALYSDGGSYLSLLAKNIDLDFASFFQSFFFSLPHSFGYAYPSRSIGTVSAAFALFIIANILLLTVLFLKKARNKHNCHSEAGLCGFSTESLQTLFLCIYPVYFLCCLSLSPKQIYPFEYWPNVGLFAQFGVADIYQYRWLHSLYPFYFAVVGIGTAVVFKIRMKYSFLKILITSSLLFFLAAGVYVTGTLLSKKDYEKIFFYKGYNYERHANRLILGNTVTSYNQALRATLAFPDDVKNEAYRCLGTKAVETFISEKWSPKTFSQKLDAVPDQYVDDFVYGIVRARESVSFDQLLPILTVLEECCPDLFFHHWGYRYLAYEYYGSMINFPMLLSKMSEYEKYVFNDFITAFIEEQHIPSGPKNLMREIVSVPEAYQYETVKGIGRLVGAEMLFDTSHTPNYPLDIQFRNQLPDTYEDAFLEGVGAGLAETFLRFCSRLLPSKQLATEIRFRAVETERNRLLKLLNGIDAGLQKRIMKGVIEETQRELPDHLNESAWILPRLNQAKANNKES